MNLLERARAMVCEMNPSEARRFQLHNPKQPVNMWPEFAQRDFKICVDNLVAVRAEALAESQAK